MHPTPPTVAPYGSWHSPLDAADIAAGGIRLGQLALDGQTVYWEEGRPTEAGRTVLVRRTPDGRVEDATPTPFSVRTRVHEYGGGAFAVAAGLIVFSNQSDNRLYRLDPDAHPRPITPDRPALRYADLQLDLPRRRLLCVREDHSAADQGQEPVNTLVAVDLDPDNDLDDAAAGRVLAAGHDFFAAPRLDRDGARLAWLSWDHPNLPWDGCDLWLAAIEADGSLGPPQHVAGGAAEAIFQPEWGPDGSLFFVSDRTGWGNLYRFLPRLGAIDPLWPIAAEFAKPQWSFAQSTYAVVDDRHLLAAPQHQGGSLLHRLDLASGQPTPIPTPATAVDGLRATADHAVFVGGNATTSPAILRLDLRSGETTTLRPSRPPSLTPDQIAAAHPITFPTEGGLTAHAFYYPPTNPAAATPPGELPPLLVKSHGGPTGNTTTALDLAVQFWTSRGFAVVDVDYGGSTGYGRAYRQRLDGRWGIVDVDDCLNAARHLIAEGLADPRRVAIRGSSASGYTTLAALAFRDLFTAGASFYGIGDLEAMTRDTHKFERRYLDRLVAPYPEQRDVYHERSPVHHADRITAPVILFQGEDDKVVLPNQAEAMAATLAAKGLPVAHLAFAGEGHGFRRAETIRRALQAELAFYARVFGIATADPLPPLAIANLPGDPS